MHLIHSSQFFKMYKKKEFVSSSEQIWRNLALHQNEHTIRVQTADENGTVVCK